MQASVRKTELDRWSKVIASHHKTRETIFVIVTVEVVNKRTSRVNMQVNRNSQFMIRIERDESSTQIRSGRNSLFLSHKVTIDESELESLKSDE